jgi:phage-related tail protein
MKFYFSAAMDLDNHNYEMLAKDRLWPFTVLEYQRAALGALQGASNSKSSVAGASQTQKAIGGALGGAAAGAMIGSEVYPGYGTAIGAVIGGALGAASAFL